MKSELAGVKEIDFVILEFDPADCFVFRK